MNDNFRIIKKRKSEYETREEKDGQPVLIATASCTKNDALMVQIFKQRPWPSCSRAITNCGITLPVFLRDY